MYPVTLVRRGLVSANKLYFLIFALTTTFLSGPTYAQWPCSANLSTEQIRKIIKQARERYTNLPRESATYDWYILRVGCHYRYSEEVPTGLGTDDLQFTLNPSGVLVDFDIVSIL